MHNFHILVFCLFANTILAQNGDYILKINYYSINNEITDSLFLKNDLAISFTTKKPNENEIVKFLETSKINIKTSEGLKVFEETTLMNLIKSRNYILKQAQKDLLLERGLNIKPLLPILKVGDVITLTLTFKDNVSKIFTFKVIDIPHTIDKDILSQIEGSINGKLDSIKDGLKLLQDGQQKNFNSLNERISEIEGWKGEIEKNFAVEKMSKKEKKKAINVMRNVQKVNNKPNDLCKDCEERIGSFIYDFKCKILYKVISDGNNGISYEHIENINNVPIKEGELVELKIVNINRYLYNIESRIEDKIWISETPQMFSSFFSGNSELYSNLIEKGNSLLADDGRPDDQKQNEQLKIKLKTYKTKENKLINLQTSVFLNCDTIETNCCTKKTSLGDFLNYLDALQDLKSELSKYDALNFSLHTSSDKIKTEITQQKKKIEDCNLKILESKTKINILNEEEKKATAERKISIQKEKDVITIELSKCSNEYTKAIENEISKLSNILAHRVLFEDILKTLPSETELRNLYIFVANIDKDDFVFKFSPIYPKGHKLNISALFYPRDQNSLPIKYSNPLYRDSADFEFIVKNKRLFSFSSGPFFAFGRNLSAPSYGFKQIPASGTVIGADARYRLDATGDGPLPVGLGAYANIGKIFLGLSGTIGVGYTFNQDTPLPGFMGGLTTTFGDNQRINLTAGAAFIQVRELKKDLYFGNVYETIPTLEYNKPMRIGFFLSASYSILTSAVSKSTSSKSK